MNGILKVEPQQLITTAGEFSNQGNTITTLTGEMMTLVTGLSSAWEGDAATAYINRFKGLEDDIQRMIAMVKEHADDLTEMARIYTEADTQNAETANSLSSDVIV